LLCYQLIELYDKDRGEIRIMDMRTIRTGLICLVTGLLLAASSTALANDPPGSIDEGIYGNSEYNSYTVSESGEYGQTNQFDDGGTGDATPVPEPSSLILMSCGIAFLSRRYLRRSAT